MVAASYAYKEYEASELRDAEQDSSFATASTSANMRSFHKWWYRTHGGPLSQGQANAAAGAFEQGLGYEAAEQAAQNYTGKPAPKSTDGKKEPCPKYVVVWRFANRNDPDTTRPRGSDPATIPRAEAHMAGFTVGSPFVSTTRSFGAAAQTDDQRLQSIIYGTFKWAPGLPWTGGPFQEPGGQTYLRAPDLGMFIVPRSRLIYAEDVGNAPFTAVQEQEALFSGGDLRQHPHIWFPNPYLP